jgi:DNA primase
MAVRGRPQYMVAVVLRQDESGEKYKEELEKISGKLISRRNQEKYNRLLADAFKWISISVRVNSGELKSTGSIKKELEAISKELL